MSSLTELREKVERASGHDDAINVSIYARLHEPYPIAEEIASRRIIPDYTGSVDAALALVERKAPSEAKAILCRAVEIASNNAGVRGGKLSSHLPRAIVGQMLRALESQEQAGG